MAMHGNRRVIITTPFPTPEEAAAAYGMSSKRLGELQQLIAEIRAEEERHRTRRRPAAARKTGRAAKKK
jgi:hypothetical protein